MRYLVLLSLIGELLGQGQQKPPKPLWSMDPEGYLAKEDFGERSLFTADVVLLMKRGGANDGTLGLQVRALDPATGAERWRLQPAEWLLHEPGHAAPLYVMSRYWPDVDGADEQKNTDKPYRELRQINPANGKVLRRIALKKSLETYERGFFFAQGRIYSYTSHELSALDPLSGSLLWTARIEANHLFSPVVAGDAVIFPGPTYHAYALGDGAPRFIFSGMCCTALATPDGSRIFVRRDTEETAELDRSGAVRSTYPGTPKAVSAQYVATDDTTTLRIYPLGSRAPIFVLNSHNKDGYVSSVTLHGTDLFYFRSSDSLIWRRDLVSGRTQAVAQGVVDSPPMVAPPYLFVQLYQILGYRLSSP